MTHNQTTAGESESSGAPLLKTADVLTRLRASRSALTGMIERHEFPQPIRVGRVYRWNPAAVEQWISEGSGK